MFLMSGNRYNRLYEIFEEKDVDQKEKRRSKMGKEYVPFSTALEIKNKHICKVANENKQGVMRYIHFNITTLVLII